ncbi:MAG: hypothetical protein IBX72_12905 [Nitrospirae bacterium]|nr:hypothetical protein [Nitrospirota bacterium]
MKKVFVTGLVMVVSLILVSAVYAYFPGKGYGFKQFCNADIETVKKFQRETLPLRDELITKRLEIRKEYAKEKPDSERIATLQKEIMDIRTKIQQKAEERGLPAWKGGKIGHGKKMGRGMKGATGYPCPRGW